MLSPGCGGACPEHLQGAGSMRRRAREEGSARAGFSAARQLGFSDPFPRYAIINISSISGPDLRPDFL